MIPYVEVHTIGAGPISVPVFLVLVVAAIAVACSIIVIRGHRRGLAYERTEELCLWAALAGYVGAHVFRFAYTPELWPKVAENPGHLLVGGIASFGGFFGGLAGVYAFFRRRKINGAQRLKFLDLVGFALPFSWVFGRIGCALVHDHPGLRTTSWFGVQFPGGTRYDLGLLEVFFLLALAFLFFLLDRRERPTGFFFGWFFFLYGIFRFGLDQLHVDPPRYFGWTVDQYASSVAVAAGLLALAGMIRANGFAGLWAQKSLY